MHDNLALLKAGSALAVVLHIGLNSAAFAAKNEIEMEDIHLTQNHVKSYNTNNDDLESNNRTNTADTGDVVINILESSDVTNTAKAGDVVINIDDNQQNDDTPNTLATLKQESDNADSMFDTIIKTSLVTGGVAVGGALAWFYGPALAYTIASKGSLLLFNLANPNASWLTYNLFAVPASINAGLALAKSSAANFVIGTASSALGGGLGKAGCAAYDTSKSGYGWLKGKVFG